MIKDCRETHKGVWKHRITTPQHRQTERSTEEEGGGKRRTYKDVEISRNHKN